MILPERWLPVNVVSGNIVDISIFAKNITKNNY